MVNKGSESTGVEVVETVVEEAVDAFETFIGEIFGGSKSKSADKDDEREDD